jgi:thiol:disulfide interchange protein DsbD
MRTALCVLVLALVAAGAAPAAPGEPELLTVEQAFRFTLLPRGKVLRIEAQIAEGYYLYRDRLAVAPAAAGMQLGELLRPPGQSKDDPLFGTVQVYRGRTSFDVPLLRGADGPLAVALSSQGCADLGVCYPPDTRTLRVAQPQPQATQSPAASGSSLDALLGLTRSLTGDTLPGSGEAQFLSVDEAFRVRALAHADGAVTVSFDIAPGYYLYREQMGFEAVGAAAAQAARVELPPGTPKTDPYYGQQQVFYGAVEARVHFPAAADVGAPRELLVRYQGCADAGLCYPPQQRTLQVTRAAGAGVDVAVPGAASAVMLSETDELARVLLRDAPGWMLLTFFVAGLLLAFTPCVLPMVPILSAIIGGQHGEPSARRGFALSAVYVLAMSLTYTAAGVIAGLFGQNLQALFQHPAVLIGFSAVFVALALAMFGVYELQLPVALQTRLAALSQRQRGGSYLGVGVMGVLSALIVGPCVAAPLAAALIVIGTTGDPLRGGMALFALSLGMGVPLLAVGVFGPRLLPRAGPWMGFVKNIFGLLLLAVAVYLLARLLDDAQALAAWAALALIAALVLVRRVPRGAAPSHPRLRRWRLGAGAAALVYAAALAVGAATGGSDPLRPLAGLGSSPHTPLGFQRIKSVHDLDRVLAAARRDGRTVMLDFYADWCVSCKQLERETFSDPRVRAQLRDSVLIQADVTAYDADDKALLDRFGLYGPPAILFFGRDGREQRGFRVIGFIAADAFQPHIAAAARS